ncbi:complement c3f, putative [Ixodes scapularis]|uniref:Lysophospholipid acyltransferase 5 n=1 Tax=Ixodes scapularis TaxID=6945 RepID=B7PE51_IXOSC|nr:complement c3f, putative [Ixodes scapularis]|eukprot:XP_002399954.1 complement c3f, putative [Ixodes scapularis]
MTTASDEPGIVGQLASYLGSSEPAFRLLLTVLAGYPLALVHRNFFLNKNPVSQHLYFTVCGLLLCCFNYGFNVYHSLLNILVVYAVLRLIGGTLASVAFSFIFCMGYLVLGYYFTATKEYDITWTMPHCILALRLVGLVFDVYDGKKDPATLPYDQKRTALQGVPSLLEVMGHSYFFGGFLVGPQFPMKRYLDFVQGTFFTKKGEKPSCIVPALMRMGLGLLCLLFSQLGSLWLDEKYMLSDEYMVSRACCRPEAEMEHNLKNESRHCHHLGRLQEGSCIMAGLTHNGKDENGNDLWNGCVNISVWRFETTTTFDGIIKTFNINTNLWVAQYVFKRLRFLGNKQLSQLLALLFLAVWHGLHSGYYVCFFNEFIVMKFEKDMVEVIERVDWLKRLVYHRYLQVPRFILLKLYVLCMFGYCIVPFALLSFDRYTQAYGRIYWLGHIVYLGWFPLAPFVFKALPRKKAEEKAQ